MKSFQEVQKIIEELENTHSYNQEQLQVIKYALYSNDLDASDILDPSIPSEYMQMYLQLKRKKVDTKYYINNKWHELGFNSKQLSHLIDAHAKGLDVSGINQSMSEEEIKNIINNRWNQIRLKETREESGLSETELEEIKSIGFSKDVEMFLLRIGKDNDIKPLLNPKLKSCLLEQMKYLYSVLSTGYSIEKIIDPSLSVEEMKEIILSSHESLSFLEEIKEYRNH